MPNTTGLVLKKWLWCKNYRYWKKIPDITGVIASAEFHKLTKIIWWKNERGNYKPFNKKLI